VPDFDAGTTRALPNERYGIHKGNQKGLNNARPVVIMMDEMAKMPKHIQATVAPLFYDRRLGSYTAPELSVVFGTTNMGIEGLGDFMPAHTRNRIIIVRMRKPTAEEWVNNFAVPRNLSAEVIAFVHQYPSVMDSFIDYEPGGKYAGKDQSKDNPYIFNPRVQQDAYATPRSLHAVSDILKNGEHLEPDVVVAALNGTVGVATGREMDAYVRFGRELPLYERVIADPDGTPLPKSPVAQIVQVFQLVTRVGDRAEAEATIKYVKRMKDEMSSLFCTIVAKNTEKVTKFASVTVFHEMLKQNSIYFNK
jgi:hypothetical protein